jgi:hypothetical protein
LIAYVTVDVLDHVPLVVVSVLPTAATPLIAGAAVWTGAPY